MLPTPIVNIDLITIRAAHKSVLAQCTTREDLHKGQNKTVDQRLEPGHCPLLVWAMARFRIAKRLDEMNQDEAKQRLRVLAP